MELLLNFVVLTYLTAVSYKDLRIRENLNGGPSGQSILEIVQRLVKDVDVLKAENRELKEENKKLIANDDKLLSQVSNLNHKGYGQFSFYDQQWQSLHMSAAAACRGSTPHGGHGTSHNTVYPRTKDHTCDQVCKATKYFSECDASLSIMGWMGKIKSPNQMVGMFYNYGCGSAGYPDILHEETAVESSLTTYRDYIGYCCCRHSG